MVSIRNRQLAFEALADRLRTCHRANRAQFAEVSLLTFVEEESLEDVALPTVQGLATDDCEDSRSYYSNFLD